MRSGTKKTSLSIRFPLLAWILLLPLAAPRT
jgi:hypothetical protein